MRPRVLVIEDDPAIQAVFREALELDDYAVETVTGRTALPRARAFVPDVIILDLHMPGEPVSGETIYRQIRADPALAHIPVCISTALPGGGSTADALGSEGKLLKPFDILLLHDELGKLVQLSYERRKRAESAERIAP